MREEGLKNTTKALRREANSNWGSSSGERGRQRRGRMVAILFLFLKLWTQDGVDEIKEKKEVSLVCVVRGVAEEEEGGREQLRQVENLF